MKQPASYVDEKLKDAQLTSKLALQYGKPTYTPFTKEDLQRVQVEQFQREHNRHDSVGLMPEAGDQRNSGCLINALCIPVFLFIRLMHRPW